MNDNQLDKLFQASMETEQSFSNRTKQWKTVQKSIPKNKMKYILWSSVLCLVLISGTVAVNLATGNSNSSLSSTPLIDPQDKVQQASTADQLESLATIEGVEKQIQTKNATYLDPSKKTTVQKHAPSASHPVIPQTKPNFHKGITLSKTQQIIGNRKEISSVEEKKGVENAPPYSYSAKTIIKEIKKRNPYSSYSSYQNENLKNNKAIAFEDSSVNYEGAHDLIETLNNNKLENKIMLPQLSNYAQPILGGNEINISVGIFTGVSQAFTRNSDLILIKPNSYLVGTQYRLLKLLYVRASYEYSPFDVQVVSNFEDYDIQRVGSYEPVDLDRTNVRGENHILSLGLTSKMKYKKWNLYPMIHSNFTYRTSTMETQTYITPYQFIEVEEEVSTQLNFSSISPGIGIQYNLGQVGLAIEYEYNMPIGSLYGWTGIQNINFLVHYNL